MFLFILFYTHIILQKGRSFNDNYLFALDDAQPNPLSGMTGALPFDKQKRLNPSLYGSFVDNEVL